MPLNAARTPRNVMLAHAERRALIPFCLVYMQFFANDLASDADSPSTQRPGTPDYVKVQRKIPALGARVGVSYSR
jgi:hypothetical protein